MDKIGAGSGPGELGASKLEVVSIDPHARLHVPHSDWPNDNGITDAATNVLHQQKLYPSAHKEGVKNPSG